MSRTWTKNAWDDTRPQRFWRSYAAAKRAHLSPDVKLIAVNSLKGALTITEEE